MTMTTKLKTRIRVLSSLSLSLSVYVQEEFLKQKSSSFFLRDLWISHLLLGACGRTEAIYLYSISSKLGTYTKFLLLLLLRYATMPLSLLPRPSRPSACQPATDQTSSVPIGSATAGAKTQEYETRQLSDEIHVSRAIFEFVPAIFTYYTKEQAQVGGRALTDAMGRGRLPADDAQLARKPLT
jgi:hypothetical protein